MEANFEIIREVKTVSDKLLEMHARFDKDGLPLWYVPREWGEAQRDLLKEVKETNRILVELAQALKK